jgi:hypothetical protein
MGILSIRGERRDILGSLRYDAAWSLAHAFANGVFQIVDLHGVVQRGGRTEIRSIGFCRAVDPEDP